jgi:hypothetical protein
VHNLKHIAESSGLDSVEESSEDIVQVVGEVASIPNILDDVQIIKLVGIVSLGLGLGSPDTDERSV